MLHIPKRGTGGLLYLDLVGKMHPGKCSSEWRICVHIIISLCPCLLGSYSIPRKISEAGICRERMSHFFVLDVFDAVTSAPF